MSLNIKSSFKELLQNQLMTSTKLQLGLKPSAKNGIQLQLEKFKQQSQDDKAKSDQDSKDQQNHPNPEQESKKSFSSSAREARPIDRLYIW